MKLNNSSKNLLALAVAVVACFVIAELIFAFFGVSALQQDVSSYRQADGVLHHGFVPNGSGAFKSSEWDVSYSISSLGFRDREYGISKPENTFRILMLGDSYTEGYGVEAAESFSKQLEKMLNDKSSSGKANVGKSRQASAISRDYEVINTGVGSYSPIIEYLLLKYKGVALQPDMVILNFDWSDPYDDYVYSKLAVFNGSDVVAVQPAVEKPKSLFGNVRAFLSRHSRVYQFFALRFASATSDIVPGALGSDRLIFLRDNLTDSDYAALFNNSAPYLLKIRQLLQQNNVSFAIHVYPYALQVSAEAWKSGRKAFFFSGDKVYTAKPFAVVEEFGKENSITVVSSYSYFRNRSDLPQLYFDYDGHWTPKGHEVVATALHDYIQNSTA